MGGSPLGGWLWVDGEEALDQAPATSPGVEEGFPSASTTPSHHNPLPVSSQKAFRRDVHTSEVQFPYRTVRCLDQGDGWRLEIVKHKNEPWREYLWKRSSMKREWEHQRRNELLKTEANLLRELRHEHVVQIFETFERAGQFSMLIAPTAGTTLSEVLYQFDTTEDDRARKRTFDKFRGWVPCLTKALAYLHSQNVEHGNIQPSNILVTQDRVIISDFGRARRIGSCNATNSGTMEPAGHRPASMYAAPTSPSPLLIGADDIYSLGCIFAEMATGICDRFGSLERFEAARASAPGNSSTASYARCEKQLVQWISMLSTLSPLSISSRTKQVEAADWTRMLVDLAFRMIAPSPESRPTADMLLRIMHWFCFDFGKCLCEGGIHPGAEMASSLGRPVSGGPRKLEGGRNRLWDPLLYNLEAAQFWDFDTPISPWEVAQYVAMDGVAENVVISKILSRAAERRTQPFQVGRPPHSYFLDKGLQLSGTKLRGGGDLSSLPLDSPLDDIGRV